MTISREMRESLLTILSPVPYFMILLPILSFSANVHPVAFLFVFSITVTFFYLFLAESMGHIRSNLRQSKDTTPASDKEYNGLTYSERFWAISYDAILGVESDTKPITESNPRPIFPYLVYSFWGTLISFFTFIGISGLLSWLVTSGNLDSIADIPLSENVVQSAPLGLVDFLLALFPIFDGLGFEDQIFIGGVILTTGFIFMSAARNFTEISDEFHRRALRFLVSKNPFFRNEFLNSVVLSGSYILIFLLT